MAEAAESASTSGPTLEKAVTSAARGVVLIAVNSQTHAINAFDWYLKYLHRHGNSIVLLHCIDRKAQEDSSKSPTRRNPKAVEDEFRWKLNELALCGKIRSERGKAGENIVRVAQEEKATLIVIGSRGLNKLQRTIQTSVSDYVLHKSPCSVLICKKRTMDSSPSAKTSQDTQQ